MPLSKESEDAFLQCLRILAPLHQSEYERRTQAHNVATLIKRGEWISALRIKHIALLFYPTNPAREADFLLQMQKAIEAKDLLSLSEKPDGLLPCYLAAWPDCPPVPLDSPLRFWLPAWMHAAPTTVEVPKAEHVPLKKSALIEKHAGQWKTIEADFHSAIENGLSEAAQAQKRGYWREGDALKWARQRGKLKEKTADVNLPWKSSPLND
jgi:hypothetical protein